MLDPYIKYEQDRGDLLLNASEMASHAKYPNIRHDTSYNAPGHGNSGFRLLKCKHDQTSDFFKFKAPIKRGAYSLPKPRAVPK